MKRQTKIHAYPQPFVQLKVNILQPFVGSSVVRKKLDSDAEKARCVMECDDSGSPFVEQRVNQISRFGSLMHVH
jgi:hypothetical protein